MGWSPTLGGGCSPLRVDLRRGKLTFSASRQRGTYFSSRGSAGSRPAEYFLSDSAEFFFPVIDSGPNLKDGAKSKGY